MVGHYRHTRINYVPGPLLVSHLCSLWWRNRCTDINVIGLLRTRIPHVWRETTLFPDQFPTATGGDIGRVHCLSINWNLAIIIAFGSATATQKDVDMRTISILFVFFSKHRLRPLTFNELLPKANGYQHITEKKTSLQSIAPADATLLLL